VLKTEKGRKTKEGGGVFRRVSANMKREFATCKCRARNNRVSDWMGDTRRGKEKKEEAEEKKRD